MNKSPVTPLSPGARVVTGEVVKNVMLNPESVILNLFQNLFRASLFQHLTKSMDYETLK